MYSSINLYVEIWNIEVLVWVGYGVWKENKLYKMVKNVLRFIYEGFWMLCRKGEIYLEGSEELIIYF